MTTVAPSQLKLLMEEWEDLPDYPSAVISGIVPDDAHLDNGGYHVSINDLIRFGNAGDYSNTRPLDKAPPVTGIGKTFAAAGDMSVSKADMVKMYGRVKRVWQDRTDPRCKWINAWNVWDGIDGHLPDRFNFQTGGSSKTDKSHEWHSHLDFPRLYVDTNYSLTNCIMARKAALSILKGETKEQWLNVTQPATDPFQNKSRYPSPDGVVRTQDQKIQDLSAAIGWGKSFGDNPYWLIDQINDIVARLKRIELALAAGGGGTPPAEHTHTMTGSMTGSISGTVSGTVSGTTGPSQ